MKKANVSKRIKTGAAVAVTSLAGLLAAVATGAAPVLDVAAWGGSGTNHNELRGC